jgi:hypothetical protein
VITNLVSVSPSTQEIAMQTTPEIRLIDKAIDANRLNPPSPERYARECDLFRQRGFAQQDRDQKVHAAAMRAALTTRIKPAKKCPTCGCKTLQATA